MFMRRKPSRALGLLGVMLISLVVFAIACGDDAAPAPAPAPYVAPTAVPAVAATAVPAATAAAPKAAAAVDSGPKQGGFLRYAAETTPDTLDPHLTAVSDIYQFGFMSLGRLLELNRDGSIKPLVAKSWTVSADGSQVTFELEKGVKFHDGTELDAAAVAWNFARIFDPDVPSPRRTEIKNFINKVTADGSHTVTFHMPKAFRGLLVTLATERSAFLISPTAQQALGEDFGSNPVGAGPYKFVDWVVGQHINVERFDGYFEPGKPYLDKIKMQSVSDDAVRIAMLRTGESDLIRKGRIRPDEVPILERNPRLKVTTIPGIATYGMLFNVSKAPYTNKALREGMNLAFNREDVVIGGFSGVGRPAYSMESQGWAHHGDLEILKYDPAKAKAKLAEAGYNGEPLPLACLAGSRTLQICEAYQAVWADNGVNMDIQAVPRDRMWGPTNHAYKDVGMMSTWYTHRPDPYLRLSWIYQSDGWYNPNKGYNDPTMDKMLSDASAEYDQTKASQMYRDIFIRGGEAALWVYAVWADGFVGMDKKVMDYFPTATIGDRLQGLWFDE